MRHPPPATRLRNHDYLSYNQKTEPYMYLKTFGPSGYINNPKLDELSNNTLRRVLPSSPTFAWGGMKHLPRERGK